MPFVFSSETMEKLLKREKEVFTLTSQVEALKSQVGGKLSSAGRLLNSHVFVPFGAYVKIYILATRLFTPAQSVCAEFMGLMLGQNLS